MKFRAFLSALLLIGAALLSCALSGAAFARGFVAPTAPTNVRGQLTQGHVVLTWDAVAGATSYNIYRGVSHDGEGTTPYKSGIISTTFTNTLVAKDTTYYYAVSAVNADGESPPSNEVSVSTALVVATPAPTATSQVTPAPSSSALPAWLSRELIIAVTVAFLAGLLAGVVFGRASARSRKATSPMIPIGESAEYADVYPPDSAEVPQPNQLRSRPRPAPPASWDDSRVYGASPDWAASGPPPDSRSYPSRQWTDQRPYGRRPPDDDDWDDSRMLPPRR